MFELNKLAEPFPADDIEWRVSRSGMGQRGIFCFVLAYVTARAIQKRLDEVCGVENWRTEQPRILDVNGKTAFAVGISINIAPWTCTDETTDWVTKWDVAEPTREMNQQASSPSSAKGGFSGAMKRAGAQWGIGRYLYHIDETFAEVSDERPAIQSKGWNWAKLSEKQGGASFYWKTPTLPGWALPKEPEQEVSTESLNQLKRQWRDVFAKDSKDPAEMREGWQRFVESIAGDFPSDDSSCWTLDAYTKCLERIQSTTEPDGVSSDVPFEA